MFSYTDMMILASNLDDDCTTTEDEETVDDREACPGCGCKPGEGYTHGCQACQETQDTLAGDDEGADEEGDETMAIQIKTEAYENSHGRKPRGRGMWAFEMVEFCCNAKPTVFMATGSYSEALKLAKREARSLGTSTITVCP